MKKKKINKMTEKNYVFVNYYDEEDVEMLNEAENTTTNKLTENERQELTVFLQRFQATLEDNLVPGKSKKGKNLPVASLTRNIFERFFETVGEKIVRHKYKNDNEKINVEIIYRIKDKSFLKGGKNGPSEKMTSKIIPVISKFIPYVDKTYYCKLDVKLKILNDLVFVDWQTKEEAFDFKTEKFFDK
jgi:hypothetical protein